MRGPACVFWASLTPFSRKAYFNAELKPRGLKIRGKPAELSARLVEAVRVSPGRVCH
jgi:hypothetical protein